MHIDRALLLRLCLDRLWGKVLEPVPEGELVWSDLYDFQLVEYLLEKIVMHDPLKDCIRIGGIESWEGLSPSKSLFCSEPGKGLPIGNLTSQLFSNIYLDGLDHFVEALVGPGRYGRYVDDFFIIGLLGKHRSHNLRCNLIKGELNFTSAIGVYDSGLRKFKLDK